jgi:hypothetical protein
MQVTTQLVYDINDVLSEFGLPEFQILPEITDVNDMVSRVVKGYKKEVRIQSIWGGIRNPPAVMQNKIRHDLTNYDEVRDALTQALREGVLDLEFVLDVREELVKMAHEICEWIINILPGVICVEKMAVSSKQLRKANDGYLSKESRHLQQEKAAVA